MFCDARGFLFEQMAWFGILSQPLLTKAELPHIRFHGLRHSTATLLLTLGVHPKIVLELFGHSQIFIALDIYSLILPTLQGEAMQCLDQCLTLPDSEQPTPREGQVPPEALSIYSRESDLKAV
ncbi:MAG TPA: tyrosine-type recombinase/integrase [Ktedonobacteraceae bacterium]|nr:tyrosine-type recombinase/integrase [Ktedonobacteraceae bacterium]